MCGGELSRRGLRYRLDAEDEGRVGIEKKGKDDEEKQGEHVEAELECKGKPMVEMHEGAVGIGECQMRGGT